jgi:hypothetical protein
MHKLCCELRHHAAQICAPVILLSVMQQQWGAAECKLACAKNPSRDHVTMAGHKDVLPSGKFCLLGWGSRTASKSKNLIIENTSDCGTQLHWPS